MLLIIGAGIGGLTTAITARQAGLEYAVFERAPVIRPVGAGIALWRNALRVLDGLDLGEPVRRLGKPNVGAALRRWDGRVLTPALTAADLARLVEIAVVVPRTSLHELLLDAADRQRVHLDHHCVSIAEREGAVTATFANGATATGTAIVGADGLHSVVRVALHGDVKPVYAGYTAWRGLVPFDANALRPGESWGPGRRFGSIAMADDLTYWFATENAPEGSRAPGGDEKAELRRLFAGWHAPIPALIEATPAADILRNDIYDRPPLRIWGRGRVTLLGDAAHPMTPNLGQGACQAIEDAVVLVRHLRGASEVPAALRAYEQARRSRVETIVAASRRIGAIGQLTNPAGIWLRDHLVRLLGAGMQLKQLEGVIGVEV